jgi:hypothetical protein
MKKHFFTALTVLTILGAMNACMKNEQATSPETVAEMRRYQLSVPLEDGRKFIEKKVKPIVQLNAQQSPITSGFLQIKLPDEAYRNGTRLMTIKHPADFSMINCIADNTLKITFTDSVRRMPGYPTGWTAVWNSKPEVEREAPAVLYTRQQNRLTLQLSRYVTKFGFELAPNLYDLYPFSVGFYDSKENPQVAYLQEVASTPGGAKLFAVSSQRPFNVVEIAFAGEGENVNSPYGFAIANIRYKLAK